MQNFRKDSSSFGAHPSTDATEHAEEICCHHCDSFLTAVATPLSSIYVVAVRKQIAKYQEEEEAGGGGGAVRNTSLCQMDGGYGGIFWCKLLHRRATMSRRQKRDSKTATDCGVRMMMTVLLKTTEDALGGSGWMGKNTCQHAARQSRRQSKCIQCGEILRLY